MNFRLVLMLSLFGVAIGVASVAGIIPPGIETVVWIVVGIVSSVVIAKQAPGRYFVHGFLTGVIAGLVASLIQAALLDQYLGHNPKVAESFKQLPPNISPRLAVTVMSPIIGLFDGIVLGFLAWLAGKMMARKRTATAT